MKDARAALMVGRTTDGRLVNRPMSPHLQVYKPQITSILSITHRATGIAVSVGTLLMVWWLVGAAASEAHYATVSWFIRSPLGILMLFGWTVVLWYHFCNGIRHLAWDSGFGFELPQVHASGRAVLGATAVLSVVTWIAIVVAL